MFHHRSSVKAKQSQRASSAKQPKNRTGIKKVDTSILSKQDRLNTLRQVRQQKKDELLHQRRFGAGDEGGHGPPPRLVVLVAFHTQADTLSLKRRILAACNGDAEGSAAVASHVPAAARLPAYAQGAPGSGRPRILLVDPPRDVLAVMDAAKCADVVLCVFGPHASLEEPAFDELGYRMLTVLKAQGLPVTVGATHGTDAAMLSAKRAAEGKKFVARYCASELGSETKLLSAGTDEEVKTLVRTLGSLNPKDITWRSDRGYMLAQEAQYSSADGVLRLCGYVRGTGFRCRHLGHLTGHGDFVLERIATLPDPCAPAPEHRGGGSAGSAGGMEVSAGPASGEGERTVDELHAGDDPDTQRLQPYDPTSAEQTWPTAEELRSAKGARRKGTVARIPAPAGGSGGGAGDHGGDAEDAEMDADNAGSDDEGGSGDGASQSEGATPGTVDPDDNWDVSSNMTMEIPTAEALAAERRRREELQLRSKDELDFPDEVDTPFDVPARERFQKYRGLKSFRTSPWDPYEDLPTAYSRIWEFEAFNSTARACRQEYVSDCSSLQEGGGVAALYCAVYLRGVSPAVMDAHPKDSPFVLSGLFPNEQKVSVVHGTVSRHGDYDDEVKSKQEVTLHCGFRRFPAKPIYSEIPQRASTCKKFKLARRVNHGATVCASFYAPTVFPPCRLLMFTQTDAGPELLASGSISTVDPKQLIIKRIILTGYPFRTRKAKGVVRFMFVNPADTRWFKPVELCTKRGLRGHIVQSLGLHGYMKCTFSGYIKQDDTVCMHLYKRAYPKWYPPAWGGSLQDDPEAA